MIAADTGEADRLILAGHALEDQGQFDQALQNYQSAARLAPSLPRPLINISNIERRQGRMVEAKATLERAIALDSTYAPAHFNLGLVYLGEEQFERAERLLREALRLDAGFDDAALALSNVLASTQRGDEAESLLKSMQRGPRTHPRVPYALAQLMVDAGRHDEAEDCLNAAIAMDPGFTPAMAVMGTLCLGTGRVVEADSWYLRALRANPDDLDTHGARLFALNARSDLDAVAIFEAHRAFGSHAALSRTSRATPHPPRVRNGRRLRIGYLSGDLCRHAVALFLRPILRHHDRQRFEVFAYHTRRREDPVTAELRGLTEHWRNLAGSDDDAAQQAIEADAIDVLIDLSGHTAGSRVTLFARRCAPVQMTWLGYLNTTGLVETDFRICDGYTDPPGSTEPFNTERLLRMPHSQWCYSPAFDAVERKIATGTSQILFGSFNQYWKVSDPCLELWIRLLRAIPEGRLLMVGVPEGRTSTALGRRFAAAGVGQDRVTFMRRVDVQRYAELIAGTDIALDTFPYNGATTTLDVLWQGTPVVAIRGERSISRGSFSILSSMQLPELIAGNPEAWLTLNVRLARDRTWRTSLHDSLRGRLERSPLMDAPRFTRDLEQLIEHALEQRSSVGSAGN